MTKFMQKSFSVYVNSINNQPKCLCGKEIIYGYATQEGYLCAGCYAQRKQKKDEERIKKVIKESGGNL